MHNNKPKSFIRRRRYTYTTLGLAALFSLKPLAVIAADSTWLANPATNNYLNNANWSAGLPGGGDTAFFDTSTQTALVANIAGFDVGGWTFNPGASNYTIDIAGSVLNFVGTGIVINGGSLVIDSSDDARLSFLNSSSAGSATIFNSYFLHFEGNSTADNATIINNPNSFFLINGITPASISVGSLAGAGNFGLGSKQLITGGLNTSTTISGVLSGTGGSLEKIGTGTLTLTGTNTYTGGTTISGGALQIGNGGTTGSIVGDVVNDSSLVFNRSNAMTYAGVISGTGSLTQAGTGTTTLTGANTYTGDTIISAGTLQIDASERIADTSDLVINGGTFDLNDFDETVANLSGTGGNIDIGTGGTGTLTVNQTVDQTYAGNFSGASGAGQYAIIKNGAATLTLTGTNSQTGVGVVWVAGGRLAVGGGNAIGDSQLVVGAGEFELLSDETIGFLSMNPGGDILLNSNTLTLNTPSGVSGSNNAAISGTGNIIMDGTGIQILSGASTYTGSTTINGGVLIADTLSALGNNGAVTVNSGGELRLSTALAIGSLAGDGAVNLGFAGAHQLTSGGDNTSTTFSGVLSGAGGSLNKTGTGTLTLTGTNTYTGGTTISDGTLQIGNGTTGSIAGDVVNNASLVFNRSNVMTFAGVISGTGAMQQNGAGNLNLTGANTYTGATTINGGILSVNGSIANSATTINTGGTLGGSGTVGSVTINGGTLAPGNSIGTLNVAGNVDFSAGGTYVVEVDAAGNSDLINATGTATLTNGSVLVTPEAGNYGDSTDYTILTAAGGLGGTAFNSASSTLAFLTPTLSYDANNVYLRLQRNTSDYASVAGTPNQMSVATALDTLAGSATGLSNLYSNLNILTADGANQAYDSLSGAQHTHANIVTLQSINQFKNILFDRISGNNQFFANNGQLMLAYNDNGTMTDAGNALLDGEVTANRGWWLRGTGNFGDIENTRNAAGADYKAGGIAAGLDFDLNDNLSLGAALGYTRTDANTANGGLDVGSYQAALYGKHIFMDEYYLSGLAGVGYHDMNSNRSINVGLFSTSAKADYHAWSSNLAIEGGRSLSINSNTSLTPFLGLEYAHTKRDRFSEQGAAGANLFVHEDNHDSLRSVIGTRVAHQWSTNKGYRFQPSAELAWVHEYMENEAGIRAGFSAAPTASFSVDGPDLDRDRARLTLGLDVQLTNMANLNLGYQGEFASSDERHDLAATLRMTW